MSNSPRRWLKILGPGLITGASDDDPSGIGTYSQAGSEFGFGTLWTALFTFPLMVAVQEACARIALQTGVGLGKSLRRKFPTVLVGACIAALFVANSLNIGADLEAVAAGLSLLSREHVSPVWLLAPITLLVGYLQFHLTYGRIFRIFRLLTLALFAYVVTVIVIRPNPGTTLIATVAPHISFSRDFLGILVAILGTTISPYLFFWQASSEVDEMRAAGGATERLRRGVSRRELKATRVDVTVGMAFSQIVMYAIILSTATALYAHGQTNVATAQQAAEALAPLAGPMAFVLFAVGLIGTGLLAIPVLCGSATYAVVEFLGIRGNLGEKARYRPTFYGILVLALLVGLAISLIGLNPIKVLVVTAIINGIVAPPILILIALLARDRKVMGARRSGRLSNTLMWLAASVMTVAAIGLLITSFLA
jgi:NRAMP (natural resistance-associated macrophage protein)-like metal ion transporter